MKEIGGYLGLEKFSGREYHSDLIAINSARNALLYIVKAKKINKLYIPYYLCDSVECACKREGIALEYYHIDRDFLPKFDRVLGQNEYLYIVNYYGQLDKRIVRDYKKRFSNIILDNVQAFFEKPIEGIDTVYSCRKFFGVPDGAYVSTDVVLNEPLDIDVSMERMRHVLGRFEVNARDYFSDFRQSDKQLEEIGLRKMSKLTHNILSAIDYDAVKQARETNFEYLQNRLGHKNMFNLKKVIAPYAYPFYCTNGPRVRKDLADKDIFVATLWPNVVDTGDPVEKDYAENILPLPCDQRYGEDDMKRIVDSILQIIK